MNKIISYLGFANKAKKLVIGQSSLKSYRARINLVMVCDSASVNLKDLAQNIANRQGCECIVTKTPLEDLTHIKDVKIIGITDENLSKAIIDNKEIINIG